MSDDRPTFAVRGDRFSGGPARSFLSSMADDAVIFEADLAVDRAHTVMLAEAGILSESDAAAILDGLDAIEADGFEALPEAEDVHEAIETALIDRIGEAGGRLHTGRSRNDEVATCIRYRLREELLALGEATIETRVSLATVAEEQSTTVMPGFTHLQPAQPISVGHWALSHERALARVTERLLEAYDRVNTSPLGAAAFAGTAHDIDPQRTASLLGFDATATNAMDAVASRDVPLEVLSIAASASIALSSLAEDLLLFANRGLVELDDNYASTSSIMPQKKNPDTLELVRASTGDVMGAQTAVQTALKGLPRAYNRDLQAVTPHVWDGVTAATRAATVAAGAVTTASWDAASLEAVAGEGAITATDVADHLVTAGVPFRTAHTIVADAVAAAGPSAPRERLAEAIDEAAAEHLDTSPLEVNSIVVLLDPSSSVERRDSPGGTAPSAIATQLSTVMADLDDHAASFEAISASLAAATQRLTEAIDLYA